MNDHLVRAAHGTRRPIEVTRQTAGWDHLDFAVYDLEGGHGHEEETAEREMALVPLSGDGIVRVEGDNFEISRDSVWTEMPRVVYVPPGRTIRVSTVTGFSFALGGAPAEGRYPTRVFEPSEMKSEVRGGGASLRQVNHVLAHPLPAERLILYEVYVPRGMWSGWPPHCHDGFAGSPYLEETYYFRLDPADGFAMHRNWRTDTDFDETLVAGDGDTVLVTEGFHSSVACPGSNMFFLNYLAGELEDDGRGTPPHFDPNFTWIEDDWSAGVLELPAVGP